MAQGVLEASVMQQRAARAVVIAALSATPGAALGQAGSVYRIDPVLDGSILLAATTIAAVPYVYSEQLIDRRCPCDQDELNALDRTVVGNDSELAYQLATLGVGLAVFIPLAVDVVDVGNSPAFLQDLVVYAQTLAISGAAVAVTKHLLQRPLPLVYGNSNHELVNEPEGYRAFYSGHVAHTVAMMTALAMTVGYRDGPSWVAWTADVVFASAVAGGLLAAGRHFYTDVIAGCASGLAIGTLVPCLHRNTDLPIRFAFRSVEDGALLSIRMTL